MRPLRPQWVVNRTYRREDLRGEFPGLGLRESVALSANEDRVAVVTLRQNRPGWVNWFIAGTPVRFRMNVNELHGRQNAWLQDPALPKLLFFSETGPEYSHYGLMRFEHEEADSELGLFYIFELLDPSALVPRA